MHRDSFEIWQLRPDESTAKLLFMNSGYLAKKGLTVDFANYEQTYRAALRPSDTLDRIYERFNVHRPEDFHGQSLSVSDLIVVRQSAGTRVFFVDSFGFKDVTHEAENREAILSAVRPSVRGRLREAAKQERTQGRERTQEKKRSGIEI